MDRSFLSRPEVIAASRDFVCIRLATYENKAEGDFLKSLLFTKSGELENSVFTILAPDGIKTLVRTGRSPKSFFADAKAMAQTMKQIAFQFPPQNTTNITHDLPLVANFRLALDVAACDNQPLVVVVEKDENRRQNIQESLAKIIWSNEFIGKFVLGNSTRAEDLPLDRQPENGSLLVVQPDRFGLKGKILTQVTTPVTSDQMAQTLRDGLKAFRPLDGTFSEHVAEGRRQGIFWETVIPVTDPAEKQAREKGKNKGKK